MSSSGAVVDVFCQNSATGSPTRGICSTHSGGAGMPTCATSLPKAVICGAFSAMVPTARVNGITKTRTRRPIIIMTAGRRFRTFFSTITNIGHVAITIMLAHIRAGRNGRSIQKQAASSAPIRTIARVLLVRSLWVVSGMEFPQINIIIHELL